MRENAPEMRSDAILSDETSVVNIAPAIKTPHTAFRLNFSATAKTGIEERKSSAKTTVCNINSNANRNIHMKKQDNKISLYESFSPSSEMITPPSRTSSPLYRIGFIILKPGQYSCLSSFKNIRVTHSIIRGTISVFTILIFSMPRTTIMPPSIAIASPSIGTPASERITNSPPESIAHNEMHAEKNMQKPISLFFGISPHLPAIRKMPHNSDINTDDIATLSGETSPKKRAISLPEEKPAPIAVPI